jgi:hypothetical protein
VFTVTLPMLPAQRALEPGSAAAATDGAEARDVRVGGAAGDVSDPGPRAGGERHGAGIRDIGD